MVWNALVIVTVFLPLAGLAIDVLHATSPCAVASRSPPMPAREPAARQVDIPHYQNTGETRSST